MDVVRFKTGDLVYTTENITRKMNVALNSETSSSTQIIVTCSWSEDGEEKTGAFNQDELKLWGDDTSYRPIYLT